MAPARGAAGADKRGRKKKSKSRTKVEVSSSSESDSDTHQQNIKQSKKTNKVVVAAKAKALPKDPEEFSAIYLKKITTELADDLVKVRDAQDFKDSSLKMLIHALKQGSSIYSAEEKRRTVNATG
ncbi:hypothetical protein PMIN06_009592 [Paraphaeosphaeria minitans]